MTTRSTAAGSTAWARVPLRLRTGSPTRRRKKPTTSTDLRRALHWFLTPLSRADTGIPSPPSFHFLLHPSTTSMLERWRKNDQSSAEPVLLFHPVQTKQTKPSQLSRVAAGSQRIVPPGRFIPMFYGALNHREDIFKQDERLGSPAFTSPSVLICSTSSPAQSRLGLLL